MKTISLDTLITALKAASAAHHDYERNALQGTPDERWAGWYAAYLLGRLGDITTPTILAGLLTTAPSSDDWATSTAKYLMEHLTD